MTSADNKGPDMVTCKSCGHTEPLTKKFKCSNCGAKNWGHVLPKNNRGCITEILLGILFLAGVAGYNTWKDYRDKHWNLAKTEKNIAGNIVVVYHEYVYQLEFDDVNEGSLYFVKEENGRFTQWQKGMPPNLQTGCGLIRDKEGKCISTKKICRPGFDDWDLIGLKKAVNIFRGEPFNIRSGGHYKIFTVKLGYYLPNKKITEPSAFIPCTVSDSWSEGITQLKPQQSPEPIKHIYEFNIINSQDIRSGDKIFMFTYSMPINNFDPLKPLVAEGNINNVRQPTLDSREFSFSVPGLYPMEGSPVFDEAANVIGITSFDSTGTLRAVGFGMKRAK